MSIQKLSDACESSLQRSEQQKKAALNGSASFSVRDIMTPPAVCSTPSSLTPHPPSTVFMLRFGHYNKRHLAGAVDEAEVQEPERGANDLAPFCLVHGFGIFVQYCWYGRFIFLCLQQIPTV